MRHADPAVALAWRNRMQNRMRGATGIVARLAAEGGLHPSWTADEAAVLLWELASFQVWDDARATMQRSSPTATSRSS